MASLVRNVFHRNKFCCVSSVNVATYDNTTVHHGMTRCVAKHLRVLKTFILNLFTNWLYNLVMGY